MVLAQRLGQSGGLPAVGVVASWRAPIPAPRHSGLADPQDLSSHLLDEAALAWSAWRRRHQHHARACHYRHQQAQLTRSRSTAGVLASWLAHRVVTRYIGWLPGRGLSDVDGYGSPCGHRLCAHRLDETARDSHGHRLDLRGRDEPVPRATGGVWRSGVQKVGLTVRPW